GFETNRVHVKQRVGAALVKESSSPGALDRHHLGIGRWPLAGSPDKCSIYSALSASLQYPVARFILTDDAASDQRKIGSKLRQIDQDVARCTSGSAIIRNDICQRILAWPGVDDLYVIDDPVAGSKNSVAVAHRKKAAASAALAPLCTIARRAFVIPAGFACWIIFLPYTIPAAPWAITCSVRFRTSTS